MKETMTEALQGKLGGAAMENARLTVLAMRLRAALESGEGRDAVLRESEFLASPDQAAPVVRDNAQQAFEDAVLTGTGWMRTPTPSAETIDTPEFRTLLAHVQGRFGGFPDMNGRTDALIAHIDARMAAARQETDKQNRQQVAAAFGLSGGPTFAWSYLLGLIESAVEADEADRDVAAAAREQALEEVDAALADACIDAEVSDAKYESICISLKKSLKSQPATHPAPAAGLTDAQAWQIAVDLFGTTLRDTRHPAHVEITNAAEAGGFARAILAQQPAQAVAVPDTHVLVPKEPTPEMLEAAMRAPTEGHPETASPSNAGIYRAMLAAAPTPPAAPLATHEGKAGDGKDSECLDFTEAQISAAGRVLADRSAAACNVDKDDNWKIYGDEFIADARAALAAMQAQQAGKAGA